MKTILSEVKIVSKKIIALSQNIKINKYNEIEDCVNVRWTKFVEILNCIPFYIPTSNQEMIKYYFDTFQFDGVILTGGNDVYKNKKTENIISKLSETRNDVENEILKISLKKNIPILGVCRGMQFINTYLGGKLSMVENHSGNHKHIIINCSKGKYEFPNKVNSFHNYAIPNNFNSVHTEILAKDEENNIEAFCHFEKKVLGIMWHPEREEPFNNLDVNLAKEFFCD